MASGNMSPSTTQKLAALIVAGAEQLEEKAQQQGVTAFLSKAVQRERPNERFLQNTLKNLASANRRADEKVMWAAWEAQKQLQGSRESSRGQHIWERETDHSRHCSRGHSRRHIDEGEKGCRRTATEAEDDKWRESRAKRDNVQWEERVSSEKQREQDSNRRHSSPESRSRSASRDRSRQHKRRRRVRSTSSSEGWQHAQADRADHRAAAAVGVVGGGCWKGSAVAGESSVEHSRSDSPGDDSPAAAASGAAEDCAGNDQQLLAWLASSKTVRGRGSIGPRADVPGPYLKPPDCLNPGDLQQLEQGLVRGPERPAWMQRDDAGDRRLAPAAGFLRGVLRAQGLVPAGTVAEQGLGFQQSKEADMNRGCESGSEGSGSDDSRTRRKGSKSSRKRRRKEKHSRKHKKQKREKHSRHKK